MKLLIRIRVNRMDGDRKQINSCWTLNNENDCWSWNDGVHKIQLEKKNFGQKLRNAYFLIHTEPKLSLIDAAYLHEPFQHQGTRDSKKPRLSFSKLLIKKMFLIIPMQDRDKQR